MEWERAAVAVGVILIAVAGAAAVDRRIARRQLTPETATRYRVLRRMAVSAIVAVGLLSALLTITAVRVVAGGFLASSAVLALVVGLAAQRTLGNAVAGLLIAFTQPLRIGDRVSVTDCDGVVEEIGLTYTTIVLDDGARLVIPNEKLASDTIRNATIVSREKVAEVTVQVSSSHELGPVLDLLRDTVGGERGGDVFVSALDADVTVAVRAVAPDAEAAERLERELRLRAHERLRAAGVLP